MYDYDETQPLLVIMPQCREYQKTLRLRRALAQALQDVSYELVEYAGDFQPCRGRRLLFVVAVGESGINMEYYAFLKKMRLDPSFLADCLGAVIVDSKTELYTKSIARELVWTANNAGCSFIGRPLVEATGSLNNFYYMAQFSGGDNFQAYLDQASDLVRRLLSWKPLRQERVNLLAVHASVEDTSNTIQLWYKVKHFLPPSITVQEISLRNGEIYDCCGCPYTVCRQFGQQGKCRYGGRIVQEVYPALVASQALVMLCPNYNDALSANLTAFVNRLTALFRQNPFFDKSLFAVVISGYSGNDIVGGQLISALNMNKSFFLPAYFSLCQIANERGSVHRIEGIDAQAEAFAQHLADCLVVAN